MPKITHTKTRTRSLLSSNEQSKEREREREQKNCGKFTHTDVRNSKYGGRLMVFVADFVTASCRTLKKMVELLSKVMCVVAHFAQKWSLRTQTNPEANQHTRTTKQASKRVSGRMDRRRTFRFLLFFREAHPHQYQHI